MKLGKDGWMSGVRRIKSPNFDARPAHVAIDMLVIHNISLPPDEFGGEGVAQLFTNTLDSNEHPYYAQLEGVKVSAHFFVRRDGSMIQFVSCLERAWHAGASEWQGRERCNDFSIGIELEGSDHVAFTDEQYNSLKLLSKKIKQIYTIRANVGHSDIAPERKTDPGPFFDWPRYLNSY
jgi:AmpD protein